MSVVVPWRRVCPDLPREWVAQLGVSEHGWALGTPETSQLRWGEAAVTERLSELRGRLTLRNDSFTMACMVWTNKKMQNVIQLLGLDHSTALFPKINNSLMNKWESYTRAMCSAVPGSVHRVHLHIPVDSALSSGSGLPVLSLPETSTVVH